MLSLLPAPGNVLAEEPLVVKIRPFREKDIDYTREYKYQLLELILGKTEATDGPFLIEVSREEDIAQSRVFDLVNRGAFTLIMTMTSKEREEEMLPIRIPIYKGLYGYRIFIINRRDQEKFAKIETQEELQALWAGLGHDWPDLEILKFNGFNTVGGANYRGLFAMLQEGRFDYFPRGIPEPWREVEEEQARDIMVDPTLLLQYYATAYIFVAKDNTALAERLIRGFEMAIADGSFDQFFQSHWYIHDTLELADMPARKLFRLENPLLTPETPLDRSELWYQP
jgi:hypothetical protein